MASGPDPTDGWNELIKQLNIEFGDRNRRKQLAQDFKGKHGKKGDGKGPGTDLTPYKFGRYLDKSNALLPSTNKKAQFSIDAGTRHWYDSLKLLEHAIRRSLIRETPNEPDDPVEISFKSGYDNSLTKAKAVIKDAANTELKTADAINTVVDRGDKLTIEITCPPANRRPLP